MDEEEELFKRFSSSKFPLVFSLFDRFGEAWADGRSFARFPLLNLLGGNENEPCTQKVLHSQYSSPPSWTLRPDVLLQVRTNLCALTGKPKPGASRHSYRD